MIRRLESSTAPTLNEIRSSAHRRAFVTALHVAVRGVLYISASSPNDSPGPIDLTYPERFLWTEDVE